MKAVAACAKKMWQDWQISMRACTPCNTSCALLEMDKDKGRRGRSFSKKGVKGGRGKRKICSVPVSCGWLSLLPPLPRLPLAPLAPVLPAVVPRPLSVSFSLSFFLSGPSLLHQPWSESLARGASGRGQHQRRHAFPNRSQHGAREARHAGAFEVRRQPRQQCGAIFFSPTLSRTTILVPVALEH